MLEIIVNSFREGLMITVFVFVMMMIIDYFTVLSKGKLGVLVRGKGCKQYLVTSFLGVTPGCLGAFLNVSFYMRGLVTFGAVAGGMIATSGDEAFVMLSLFPEKALLLFGIQFVIGVVAGFMIDKIVKRLKIKTSMECVMTPLHEDKECKVLNAEETLRQLRKMSFIRFLLLMVTAVTLLLLIFGVIGPETWDWKRITFISLIALALFIIVTVPDHYLTEHIWEHIFKKHLWKVFLWSCGVLVLTNLSIRYWDIESFVQSNMGWVILIAGVIGLIPESGPHLIFVVLFSKGIVPFSVLLTSSIIQDGHGMLPLLSHSIKDSIKMKLFNLGIGLGLGYGLFLLRL